MKLFLILFALISICSSQNCKFSDYSPNKDCTGFYRCSNDINSFILCPKGLLYESKIKCNLLTLRNKLTQSLF